MTREPLMVDDVRAVPGVATAERLDLRPGDVVVVRAAPGTRDHDFEQMAEQLGTLLGGTGVKWVVVEDGVTVDVDRVGEMVAE